jgi:hypothetical protein
MVLPCLAALSLPVSAGAVLLRLPVSNVGEIWAEFVIHVDHDGVLDGGIGHTCLTYDGRHDFTNCYDGHDGTDYILYDNWTAMDQERVHALAAADGEVIDAHDGEFDRCEADLGTKTVLCDGKQIYKANYVKLRHSDGMETWYWHLKKGSVLVQKGQQVVCGQALGLVGSSGYSSMPHLHFEVRKDGNWIDPYAGPNSQPQSYWVQQVGEYGLPGPWCEGEEIPEPEPEPVPEPAPEPVPEPAPEPAPEPIPDSQVADAFTPDVVEPDSGTPDAVQRPDTQVDGSPFDAGSDAATDAGDESTWVWSDGSGWGCSASGSSAPAVPWMVAFFLAALALARRLAPARNIWKSR